MIIMQMRRIGTPSAAFPTHVSVCTVVAAVPVGARAAMRVPWVLATVGGGLPYPGFLCTPRAGESPAAATSNRLNPFSKTCASCCPPFSRSSLMPPYPSQSQAVQFGHNHTGTTRKSQRARRAPSSHPHGALAMCSGTDNWQKIEEDEQEEDREDQDEGAVRAEDLNHSAASAQQQHQGNRSSLDDLANASTHGNSSANTRPGSGEDRYDINEGGGSGDRVAAAGGGAERRYAVARSLHLRRHRSRQARETALRLFRESMLLRPDWMETDSKFAVESGINEVFAAFAFSRDRGSREEDYYYSGVDKDREKSESWDKTGRGNRPDAGCDARNNAGGDAMSDAVNDAAGDMVGDAVRCLRRTLAGVGYTAFRVQERFGPAVGAMGAQRLPGPYYLRKSLDHTHAATVASLGRPRDSLDVAIRFFLLGLALPRADVERSLGLGAVSSAAQLGMLGECPVDPSLLVSLVQLFPLDAEALSPSAETAQNDKESSREQSSAAAIDPSERRQREGEHSTGREGQAGVGGRGSRSRAGAAACGVAAASDLIFATDWPPPGSTALTEDPVMYIGPDSIGLVQHAPRRVASRSSPSDLGLGGSRGDYLAGGADAADEGDAERVAASAGQAEEEVLETVLDLCCGSGVQGIAAAALRGGNALVTCVDINPRAIRFARFNALLNGLDESHFRAVAGDLYSALASRRCSDEAASPGSMQARAGAEKQTLAAEADSPRWTLGEGARREASGGGSGGGGGAREATGEPGPGALSFEDGKEASTRNSLNAPPLGGGEPAPRSDSASKFDLILVNPPFVPVPPRLDSIRRRYDVFAAGGANGEEIVEGIFRGVMDHLQPGGVLAMVSELVNPRAFDVRLRRWAGAREPKTTPASEVAVVVEERQGEGSGPKIQQRDRGDGTTPSSNRFPAGAASPGLSLTAVGDENGDNSSAWTGVVLHEKVPWTAKEYAARRAGTAREAQGWERHLALVGVEEMAPGFVFVRRQEPPSSEERGAGDEGRNRSGGEAMGDVEVQGVEKLWAPHNKAAVENTAAALSRM